MSRPDVSIIIPTYNRLDYLQQAIGSCLGQADSDLEREVIVVDDGSTDGTQDYLDTLNDSRVRPIYQGDRGPQHARNRGLNIATGEFVKFLDDDDWLVSGALDLEVNRLRQTGADLSYGGLDMVGDDGEHRRTVEAPVCKDLVAGIFDGTLLTLLHRFLCRRTLAEQVEWNPDLPCRQDLGFFLSVALEEPEYTRIESVVGCHRLHDGERVCKVGDEEVVHQTHVQILLDAVEEQQRKQTLCAKRAQAAALGLWKRAHMLSAYDWEAFTNIYSSVRSIHPSFLPPRERPILHLSDCVLGPILTERIIFPFRGRTLLDQFSTF